MWEPAPLRHEERQRLEIDLLEAVRLAQHAWCIAPDGERDNARALFMTALRAFYALVVYDREPDGG
jgi:hypothetical protein